MHSHVGRISRPGRRHAFVIPSQRCGSTARNVQVLQVKVEGRFTVEALKGIS